MLLGEDYVRELPIAPEGALARLRGAINKKPQRAFGVFKLTSEWVGIVGDDEFAVWERRQHATHARGRIGRRRGGSRVEARIALTSRAVALTVAFFVLFAVAAYGFAGLPSGAGREPSAFVLGLAGGALVMALFWVTALRQRLALRRFLDEVFAEPRT